MPSAFVLVSTLGAENDVLENLKSCESVEEVFAVQSVYDFVVKVKAETFDKLKEVIVRIRKSVPKPHSVLTMLVVEGFVT